MSGCPLYEDATQAVFGEGRTSAELMLVGEQPGSKEDLAGEPFVGPAGRLLDKALGAADLTWKLRLQPSSPGWIDLALGVPMMDPSRARDELAWEPRFSSLEALDELLRVWATAEGAPTPPLDPKAGGRLRAREVATGVGQRQGT
jgi:uracil DNA glycosylase superfamily protein